MNYWKAKVLPKIKKVFEKNGAAKKAVGAEACKAFDESKEQYGKEFEDKKAELQPKIVEIYEACPAEIKSLIREPKEAGLKKNSAGVQKFLDELVKIEFPGSKPVSEAISKVGPAYVSGPVSFICEKVCGLLPEEEKKEEEAAPPPATEEAKEETSKEGEAVKAEEIVAAPAEGEPKAEAPPAGEAAAPAAETPAAAAATEPPKAEEKPAEAEPPKV